MQWSVMEEFFIGLNLSDFIFYNKLSCFIKLFKMIFIYTIYADK